MLCSFFRTLLSFFWSASMKTRYVVLALLAFVAWLFCCVQTHKNLAVAVNDTVDGFNEIGENLVVDIADFYTNYPRCVGDDVTTACHHQQEEYVWRYAHALPRSIHEIRRAVTVQFLKLAQQDDAWSGIVTTLLLCSVLAGAVILFQVTCVGVFTVFALGVSFGAQIFRLVATYGWALALSVMCLNAVYWWIQTVIVTDERFLPPRYEERNDCVVVTADDDDDDDGVKNCVACLKHKARCFVEPCAHLCLCVTCCREKYVKPADESCVRCPVCDAEIVRLRLIHFA